MPFIVRLCGGQIRFRMVTWVPFPGVERTFTTSMKLSMMVKPIPERSSLPVVNSGVRACSTSAMPTPLVPHQDLQDAALLQTQLQGHLAQPVRVGVDDGVGHCLAHGGFDVVDLLQRGVQLGSKAGRRRRANPSLADRLGNSSAA